MSGQAIWRAAAEADVAEVYIRVGAYSPEIAERLLDALGDAIALLLENPQAGRPREFQSARARGIRSWSPRGFSNHLVFYKVSGADVEVVRFLHGARDLSRILAGDP